MKFLTLLTLTVVVVAIVTPRQLRYHTLGPIYSTLLIPTENISRRFGALHLSSVNPDKNPFRK